MIVHIVMWKVKDGFDRKAAFETIQPLLNELPGLVPGLQELQVGLNENNSDAAWDIVLRSLHDDADALQTYQSHAAHKSAGTIIGELTSQRAVVDYSC